eukprot:13914948-Alexandrium_andersonii.AAC.1
MSLTRQATKRLTPDPAVSVDSLQGALENYMEGQKSKDLCNLLLGASNSGWKNAPNPTMLSQYAPLLQQLLAIDSNAILAHSKLTAALEGCHRRLPCIFS